MASKKILVTGGAGFLGSHLCELLVRQGHDVLCLDNFRTGHESNIATLRREPNFRLLHHDVCDPLDVAVDRIYNLACPASPVDYQADPVYTLRTCVLGAMNVLELARRTGATVLQASTSEVYGDPAVHPQPESYWGHVNPIGPRACYDEGKRCAETLFFDYRRQFGVRIKVVRIFNTYGPRMQVDDGRVISNFIVQALQGKSLTVYGSGEQTRSFCYVDDLIESIVRAMNTPDDFTGPVNVGHAGEFTILELARKVLALTDSHASITYRPMPTDDPRQRRPDLALAESALGGWRPKVSLDAGLALTVDYFRRALGMAPLPAAG